MPFNWMDLEASLLADILSERTCNILAKAQESGLQWRKRKKSEFKTTGLLSYIRKKGVIIQDNKVDAILSFFPVYFARSVIP